MIQLTTATGFERSIRPRVFAYPFGVWALMAVVAVLNGIFREVVITPRVGEYAGHVISTVILIVAILVLSFLYFTTTSIDYTYAELLLIGVTWTILTVGFEFLIGYLEGMPIEAMFGQYDVLAGQVWIFVPLTLLLAPTVIGRYFSN